MLLSEDIFKRYAQWAFSVWLSPEEQSEGAVHIDARDFAIMGLGLCGETVEVLCALDAAHDALEPTPDLVKELGDVVFYAAVLAYCRGIELGLPLGAGGPLWSVNGAGVRQAQAYAMVRPAGRLAELLKKYIRDGSQFDEAVFNGKLAVPLQEVLEAWFQLCFLCGVSPEEVLVLNQSKVNSRRDRGALRGSGDDR